MILRLFSILFLFTFISCGSDIKKVTIKIVDRNGEVKNLENQSTDQDQSEETPGENPGTGTNPTPGENPGTGTNPTPDENPGTGTNPTPGENPGTGTNPTPGEKPEVEINIPINIKAYYASIINEDQTYKIDLKNLLKAVISKSHIFEDDKDDVLVEECDGRENCYTHRKHNYIPSKAYMYEKIYLKKDELGQLTMKDVYCEKNFTGEEASFYFDSEGNFKTPNGNILNCEHTWPKSKFNVNKKDESFQKSDLHHLFPSDSRLNSDRSSLDFGEVVNETKTLKCSENKYGNISETYEAGNTTFFEPTDSHKGNVARAMFYFAIRYDRDIDLIQEAFLRKWHIQDPVDQEEVRRNNLIHKFQGNRNPFIDMPNLINNINNI